MKHLRTGRPRAAGRAPAGPAEAGTGVGPLHVPHGVPRPSHEADERTRPVRFRPAASWWTTGRRGGGAGPKRLKSAASGRPLASAGRGRRGGVVPAADHIRTANGPAARPDLAQPAHTLRNTSSAVASLVLPPPDGRVAAEPSLIVNSAGLREERAGRRCSQPWPAGVATWQARGREGTAGQM